MSGLRVAIIDDKDKETEIKELTELGRSEVARMCEQLISDLEDVDREEKD